MKPLGCALLLLLLVLLTAGCGKRPYTSQRKELTEQMAHLREAAAKAPSLMPKVSAFDDGDRRAPPAQLDPSLRLGGPPDSVSDPDGKQPLSNGLMLPVEAVESLGKKETYLSSSIGESDTGLACLKEAALVLAGEDCSGGCTSARSERCARYLLGLRYVLLVTTDVNQASGSEKEHKTDEAFRGRAVLMALPGRNTWPALAFEGTSSNGRAGDTAMLHRDYKSPLGPARAALAERLSKQFPGMTTPAEWRPAP
jgi:hypothetical protein